MGFFGFKTQSNHNSVSPRTVKLSIILSLSFGFVALLSVAAVGIMVIHVQKASITASIEGGLRFLAQAYSINVRNYLSEQKEKINHLKNDPISNQKLLEFLEDNDDFEALFVINHDNVVIASTIPDIVGKGNLEHQHKSDESIGVIVSDVHYSEVLEKYTVDFVAPLEQAQNGKEQTDTLVAVLSVEHLAKITHPARIAGDYIDAYLTDNKGTLLTPSKYLKGENKGVLTQIVESQNVKDCLRANADFKNSHTEFKKHIPQSGVYADYRGETVIGTHEHIINPPWCLIVEGSKDVIIDQPTQQIIQAILIAGVVLVSLATGFGIIVARITAKYI